MSDDSPGTREILGRSRIFTPEVVNDIHMKAELGRYRMRGFSIYGLGSPPELQKFVCGKVLYNYDSLEPSERKLVI